MASRVGLEIMPCTRWYSCEPVRRSISFAHASRPESRASRISLIGSNPLFASLIVSSLPLSHVDAAVDVDLLSGDVIAFGAEERDGARDVLRLAEPAHGDLAEDLHPHVGRHFGQHVRLGEAGSDGVDGHVVLGHFDGVIAFTKSVAIEVAKYNVTVN